jgi:uncharacterized membrane protein YidH (DUF202 family)
MDLVHALPSTGIIVVVVIVSVLVLVFWPDRGSSSRPQSSETLRPQQPALRKQAAADNTPTSEPTARGGSSNSTATVAALGTAAIVAGAAHYAEQEAQGDESTSGEGEASGEGGEGSR